MSKKRVEKILPDDHLPIEEGPGRDELKRFYAISEDEAWANFDLKGWIKKERQAKQPSIDQGEFFKWMAAQELKELSGRYKNGDKGVIIEGLYLCIQRGLTTPRWLAMAFFGAYWRIRGFKSKSWDDVFGEPHPKGIHLSARRKNEKKMIEIYTRIRYIKRRWPKIPIDDHLFEHIAKKYGLRKSLANELYYEAQRRFKLSKPVPRKF